MRKIVCFLVIVLFIPPITAYAASVTSKSFVVRNWKAEMPTTEETKPDTPVPTDPALTTLLSSTPPTSEEEETGEPPDEPTIPPDDAVDETTSPDFSEEVEQGEQGEQTQTELPDEDISPEVGSTPPDFTGEVEQGDMGEEIEPEEQGEEIEPESEEQKEPCEAAPEGEQGNFFGDDLNVHEVETGEQSGEEIEGEEMEGEEPEEQKETEEQFIS